jgi:hypothetical protein
MKIARNFKPDRKQFLEGKNERLFTGMMWIHIT